jgi:hypothetical protein
MRLAAVNRFMISSWLMFGKKLRTSGILVKAGPEILKENRAVGKNHG